MQAAPGNPSTSTNRQRLNPKMRGEYLSTECMEWEDRLRARESGLRVYMIGAMDQTINNFEEVSEADFLAQACDALGVQVATGSLPVPFQRMEETARIRWKVLGHLVGAKPKVEAPIVLSVGEGVDEEVVYEVFRVAKPMVYMGLEVVKGTWGGAKQAAFVLRAVANKFLAQDVDVTAVCWELSRLLQNRLIERKISGLVCAGTVFHKRRDDHRGGGVTPQLALDAAL